MAEPGYKTLRSYQVSKVAFELGWDEVPHLYPKLEDHRQRDQIKQALRSFKQNIVEGSTDRSISSKLKLYDVARASGAEAQEDVEDAMRKSRIPKWDKNDPRLWQLRKTFEASPSLPPFPYCSSVLEALGKDNTKIDGQEGQEIILNYLLDCLIRANYLMDQQIRAVEEKHRTEGGYKENLLKKRLEYKYSQH